MSFCRITGRSRGLPRPNYFPVLPPISPADARRFCRITGKAYGLPKHHYIPVLLGFVSKRRKAKQNSSQAKTKSDKKHADEESSSKQCCREHELLPGYKYVFPVLDENLELFKLIDVIEHQENLSQNIGNDIKADSIAKNSKKNGNGINDEQSLYVYPIDQKQCGLVLPEKLEMAVRDGQVSDLLLAKNSDTLLLKLKKGRRISVGLQDFVNTNDSLLLDGEGPCDKVLDETIKAKKRKKGLDYAKKIFEDKERNADIEIEQTICEKKPKVNNRDRKSANKKLDFGELNFIEEVKCPVSIQHQTCTNFNSRSCLGLIGDWRDLQKPLIENFDWDEIEKTILDEKKSSNINEKNNEMLIDNLTTNSVILPTPLEIDAISNVLPNSCKVDIDLVNACSGFEPIMLLDDLLSLNNIPDKIITEKIKELNNSLKCDKHINSSQETAIINFDLKTLYTDVENLLVTVNEIPQVVNELKKGQPITVKNIHGLTLNVGGSNKFIPGKTFDQDFVPGTSVLTPVGEQFIPGIVLTTGEGPELISGRIINGSDGPFFAAGQTTQSENGQETFIYGQTLTDNKGHKRFVEGQTVYSQDGPKFIAGLNSTEGKFIPGQVLGQKFVPGQTLNINEIGNIFIPGRNIKTEYGTQFVPGQNALDESGQELFIPGKIVVKSDSMGYEFMAGQYADLQCVNSNETQTKFIPGISKKNEDGLLEFIPGCKLDSKFIEGQIIDKKFVPGKTTSNEAGYNFEPATSMKDLIIHNELDIDVNVVDPLNFTFIENLENTVSNLKEKLCQNFGEEGAKFSANMDADGRIAPGRIILTEQGWRFVPGQTIQTPEGPRFIPGHVIETGSGPTFIPGQIFYSDEKGPRFVPGQVIETRSGPMFVPGRIIETTDPDGVARIAFILGHIVETDQGPRFIAPDLTDTHEGGQEFSVQSFDVTQEELELFDMLGPGNLEQISNEFSNAEDGKLIFDKLGPHLDQVSYETIIDAKDLRKLGEQGKRMTRNCPEFGIINDGLTGQKLVCCDFLDVEFDATIQDIFSEVKKNSTIKDLKNINCVQGVFEVNDFKSESIKEISEENIFKNENKNIVQKVEIDSSEFSQKLRSVVQVLSNVCRVIKIHRLENNNSNCVDTTPLVVGDEQNKACKTIIGVLAQLLNQNQMEMTIGPKQILSILKDHFISSKINDSTLIIMHNLLIDSKIRNLIIRKSLIECKRILISQTLGLDLNTKNQDEKSRNEILFYLLDNCPELAEAFSALSDMGEGFLNDILADFKTMIGATKEEILCVLRSRILDRILQLDVKKLDSHKAKLLPHILQKLKEANTKYSSINEVDEEVQMENIGRKFSSGKPILILKPDFEAVVPREATRDVLCGRTAFSVLDESGLRYFEPTKLRVERQEIIEQQLQYTNGNQSSLETTYNGSYDIRTNIDDNESLLTDERSSLSSERLSHTQSHKEVIGILKNDIAINEWKSDSCKFKNIHNINTDATSEEVLNHNENIEYSNCIIFRDLNFIMKKIDNFGYTPGFKKVLETNGNFLSHHESFVATRSYSTSDCHENPVNIQMGDTVLLLESNSSSTRAKRSRIDVADDTFGDFFGIGDVEHRLLDSTFARHKLSVRPRRTHTDARQRMITDMDYIEDDHARTVYSTVEEERMQSDDERYLVRLSDGSEAWVPSNILEKTDKTSERHEKSASVKSQHEAAARREAVVKELIETEEEFCRDLDYVVARYAKPKPGKVPTLVRDNLDVIFSNIAEIAEFHRTVLLEGVKYYASEPRLLGKTFLRLERDFDRHAQYCLAEADSQKFLSENYEARDYFEEISQTLSDDKSLTEHLKLPVQRINDYQLLLKELVKYTTRLNEDAADLKKALEFMLAIPTRALDNKFLSSIEGYHGDLRKLGRLIDHNWFTVTAASPEDWEKAIKNDDKSHSEQRSEESDEKQPESSENSKERYLFLFKSRILVCKVRRISEDRSVFQLKDIVKLPEVRLLERQSSEEEDVRTIYLIHPAVSGNSSGSDISSQISIQDQIITLKARTEEVKRFWAEEISNYVNDKVALSEHLIDDIRVDHRSSEDESSINLSSKTDKSLEKSKKSKSTESVNNELKRTSEIREEAVISDIKSTNLDLLVNLTKQTHSEKENLCVVEQNAQYNNITEKSVNRSSETGEDNKRSNNEVSAKYDNSKRFKLESELFSCKETKQETCLNETKNQESLDLFEQKLVDYQTSLNSSIEKECLNKQNILRESSVTSKTETSNKSTVISENTEEPVKSNYSTPVSGKSEKPVSEKQTVNRKIEHKSTESLIKEPIIQSPDSSLSDKNKRSFDFGTGLLEIVDVSDDKSVTLTDSFDQGFAVVSEVLDEFHSTRAVESGVFGKSIKVAEDLSVIEEVSELTETDRTIVASDKGISRSGTLEFDIEKIHDIKKIPIEEETEVYDIKKGISKIDKKFVKSEAKENKILESEQESTENKQTADIQKEEKSKLPDNKTIKSDKKVINNRESEIGISSQEIKVSNTENTIIHQEKVTEDENMSGKYSMKYSASSHVEEYSSTTVSSVSGGEEHISSSSYHHEQSAAASAAIRNGSATTRFAIKGSQSNGHSGDSVFSKTIEGCSIEPGENAKFSFTLREAANGKISTGWLKDNRPMEDRLADRIVTRSDADSLTYELELQHCSQTDSGIYTAVMKNDSGEILASCSAPLSVQALTAEQKNKLAEANMPYFLVRLHDTELLENTYLRFMVKAKGDPKPDVKFFKDGMEIKESNERMKIIRDHSDTGFYELVLPLVTKQDEGRYACIAENCYGKADCEALVTVTDHKNLFEDLTGDLPTEGEKPNFVWKRDGKPFDPEERFKVLLGDDEDSLALVFQHVKPEDAGLYTCVAQTSSGNISCSAELTVQGSVNQLMREPEKPRLEVEAREAEVSLGGSAMLELQCKGFPKPEVLWRHEGKIVEPGGRYKFLYEDAESMSLLIKGVTAEDAGVYTITATNELGEDTAEMNLTVKMPPKLKKKIEDQTAMAEETIRIKLELEGTPDPVVKFYKDGQVITESDRIKIVKEEQEHILIIEKSKLSDSGSYSVVATNEISQISEYWNIKVNSKPKFLEKLGKDMDCDQGDSLTLKIKVEGDPSPTVKWTKNGTDISSNDSNVTISTSTDGQTHTLTIKKIKTTDAGSYGVVIENNYGSDNDSVGINVRMKPDFDKKLKDIQANEGDLNLELEVSVRAYPKPKVTWYLDDLEITEKRTEFEKIEEMENGNYKLRVKEVTSEIKGRYKCRVENQYGHEECEANLTVNYKPKFVKKLPEKTSIDEGATLQLEVEIAAYPEPTVIWSRNGSEISADARIKITRSKHRKEVYNLTLDLIKGEDCGDFQVSAENSMGKVICSTRVTVHTTEIREEQQDEGVEKVLVKEPIEEVVEEAIKPKISDNLEKKQKATAEAAPSITSAKMSDDSVYESLGNDYSVTVDASPAADIVWKKDGAEIKADGNRIKIDRNEATGVCRLEIVKVKPEDAGVYKFVAKNKLGEAEKQAKLEVIPESELRKPKFIKPLSDAKAPKGSRAVMNAVLTAEPVPEVQWFKNDEEITSTEECKLTQDVKDAKDSLKECSFTLTISEGKHSDSAVYKLKAKNKYGFAESSASLDIQLRPELGVLKDQSCLPGEATEFSVNIQANPKANVTWTKDGHDLSKDKTCEVVEDLNTEMYSLKIAKVELPHDGTFRVTAVNEHGETSKDVALSIYTDRPKFTKQLEDQTIKDRNYACMSVRCTGVPEPEIKWFMDGVELSSNDRVKITTGSEAQVSSRLEIEHFSVDEAGKYTAKASNVLDSAETSCVLKMAQLPPSFTKKPDKCVEVDEGCLLELMVKADGSPIPTGKWFKDGQPIELSDLVKLVCTPDGVMKLLVDKAKASDSGAYKVELENPNGKTQAQFAVNVKPKSQKPLLLKPLKDVKVVEGEPLELEAEVSGFPSPEVVWFKDGIPLRPSQNVSFLNSPCGKIGIVVDSVRPADAGSYSVEISNRLGDCEGSAKVEVLPRPRRPGFTRELMPMSAVEGYPVKMEVKVTGHPEPQVKWIHDGKEVVPDGKNIKLVSTPDGDGVLHALVIDCAKPSDAGPYEVVLTNDKGETRSKGDLDVLGKTKVGVPEETPSFVHALRDVAVDEGEPLCLSAPFKGNPIPEIEWFKDGEPLTASPTVSIGCDGQKLSLEINPCGLEHAGVYECKIKNPLGEESCKAKATVRKVFTSPVFTQPLTDAQYLPNTDAKLPARVTGNPKLDITWFKDGKKLTPSDKYREKKDGEVVALYVKDCKPEDAGEYECVAENKLGKASSKAKLEVVDHISRAPRGEPAAFIKRLGDCEVYKAMPAKFTACVVGYPEPEIEWFRNGVKIFPSARIRMERDKNGLLRLTIGRVAADDAGIYKCRAFNEHGEDTCQAELVYDSLEDKPKKPISDQYSDFDKLKKSGIPIPLADKPIISRMTDRRLTLSWKPSISVYPRKPVTYQVEMCELPDGDWFNVRKNIRSCACDVSNLEPFRDYRFRVRVENEYGVSDPSPYAQTYRMKLLPDPPKFHPYLEPGIDFRPETSPHFPKDFDIERPPHDGYSQAPQFLRQRDSTQYGVKNHNCDLTWFVYGYPKPKISYTFNDEPIQPGGRFDWSYTRNGQAALFINKMLERDVGVYEAIATNEHGEARQRVNLELAIHPEFIQRPEITHIMLHKSGRIKCRISGHPTPSIKWFKDWQPVGASHRIQMQHIEPDVYILSIKDCILKDQALYSITASNPAGSVSSSAMVYIEENTDEYAWKTYGTIPRITPRTKALHDLYDIGVELGRGTQGVVYHASERRTGLNYAAKVMHGKHELRQYMHNELDIMNGLNHRNLIRLYDAYQTDRSMALITELAGGGELVRDNLLKRERYGESEIAGYIRQLLLGLRHMHDSNIAHLSLTIGDLLVAHAGGRDLKICDFGLARRVNRSNMLPLDFGMPEYVSPETALGQGVSLASDMWSVGIITWLLLGGRSPFLGIHDVETLDRVKDGKWSFDTDDEWWSKISSEGKDFISKLLVYDQTQRMDVITALDHPWLTRRLMIDQDEHLLTTDRLRNSFNLYRSWQSNAQCRTWYRRRPLSGAYTDPSKMVYPPGLVYTPEDTPERLDIGKKERKSGKWDNEVPTREHPDYEIGLFKSESHYQNGPDTYLLQLRDVDFPIRLREYMKVAATRSPGYSHTLTDLSSYDWRTPVIHERRRFHDIMDEEIDDERKERINRYGSSDVYSLRRLRNELGTRLDSYAEAEAMIESQKIGRTPFFREKPRNMSIIPGQDATLSCLATGDPKPTLQWFKNETVLMENARITITEDEQGRSLLRFTPAADFDAGLYKVVARNSLGQTVTRVRVAIGSQPDAPSTPQCKEKSDTEMMLEWREPRHDGNSEVLHYGLEIKRADSINWHGIAEHVEREQFLVTELAAGESYQFRVRAANALGWSEWSDSCAPLSTLDEGAKKLGTGSVVRQIQEVDERFVGKVTENRRPCYDKENDHVEWLEADPKDKYKLISTLHRGRFSTVVKCADNTTDELIVAKVFHRDANNQNVQDEFEIFRTLRHECIGEMVAAYRCSSGLQVLVQEKLGQSHDILTHLSESTRYTEQTVSLVAAQILDGLQYLHWRGYCHLDLQPDNVIVTSPRSVQIKLVDFGSTRPVSKLGTVVPFAGDLEYTAPEVLNQENAYPQTDIWSLGVIVYILLSGVSPFVWSTEDSASAKCNGTTHEVSEIKDVKPDADSETETRLNISYARYRFESLFKELTQDATRFMMLVFKRSPSKRPTAEECLEHRWLMSSDFSIKQRSKNAYPGERLKVYSERYHTRKAKLSSKCEVSSVFQ